MKRPLAGVMAGYVGGLFLGHVCQPPPLPLWIAALLLGVAALWQAKCQRVVLCIAVFVSGWANLVTHTTALSPDDLRQLIAEPAAVSVRGTIVEPPQLKIIEREDSLITHTMAMVDVTEVKRLDQWEPASGRVMVITPGTLDSRYFQDQRVTIAGALEPPGPPLAEGLFDYRDYLHTRGIYYELRANSTNDWRPAPAALATPPLTQHFLDWSHATLAHGLPAVDEPLRLIWAMTLGWRTAFTGDIGDPFLRAGTMHLFAIDGLRIGMVSAMIITLLRVLQRPRAMCGLVCIPVIWFYTAATGWEPSAVRATVMMTIIILGWALKRPSDLINSLAAAALVILVWNPLQLFEAGFQLSFLVVLVIALMLPPLNGQIDRLLQFDPLVPVTHIPKWKQHGAATLRHLLQFSALSLAAWVGSIPLSAQYFNLFSPVSAPANVIAVPLGMLALMSNLGSLVCGAWLPAATTLFNHAAWFFMLAMTEVSEWFTRLPGAYWYVPAPGWTMTILYYITIVPALIAWNAIAKPAPAGQNSPARAQGTRPKTCLLISLTSLMIAFGLGVWHWSTTRHTTTLTILPLSGGQTVFVSGAEAPIPWLINCGNDSAVDGTLKPFLRACGQNRIPQLILTTGDTASCGGAERLQELFTIDHLLTSPAYFRSSNYRAFLDNFDQPPSQHELLNLNATNGCWQVLHPGLNDNFARADDNALVLRGAFGRFHVLLLSNLGRQGQSALLGRTNDLRADIVVSALPAQGEPLCDDLIHAARPKVIVIVDADYPVQHRASPKLKLRLGKAGIPVIYTRTAGAVTVAEKEDGWEVQTMDGGRFGSDK